MENSNLEKSFEWLKGCIPKRSLEQQRIAVKIYCDLAKGKPVLTSPEVEEAIHELPGVQRDDDGNIVGFLGLAINYKSNHLLRVENVNLNTWCAWDALFVPGIIGKSAYVELKCPVTKTITSLRLSKSGLSEISNNEAVISFIIPKELGENTITNFCHYIFGFKNQETFESWKRDGRENCFSFSLEEAYELGKLKNAYQFGDVLNVL